MFMTCRETSRLVAEDALDATRWQRLGMRLHLLMCRYCGRYRSQLWALGAAARKALDADAVEEPEVTARLARSLLGPNEP